MRIVNFKPSPLPTWGELRAIVVTLAKFDPMELDGWQEDFWCLFCDSKHGEPHHAGCLWRQAVEVVEREKSE